MPLAADDTGTGEPRIMARASPVTIHEVILVEWRLLNPPRLSVLTSSHPDRLDATWIVRRERSGGNDPGERTPGRTKRSLRPGCLATLENPSLLCGARESLEEWRSRCARAPLCRTGRGAGTPIRLSANFAPPYEGLTRAPRTRSPLHSSNPRDEIASETYEALRPMRGKAGPRCSRP